MQGFSFSKDYSICFGGRSDLTKEALDKYARVQAEDSVRYQEPPVTEGTVINIANHIRDAWLDGQMNAKLGDKAS